MLFGIQNPVFGCIFSYEEIIFAYIVVISALFFMTFANRQADIDHISDITPYGLSIACNSRSVQKLSNFRLRYGIFFRRIAI